MALVIVVTWDTHGNQRAPSTQRCLEALERTVDWSKHRLVVSDNGSTDERTVLLLREMSGSLIHPAAARAEVIWNRTNLGTASAINQALRRRVSGEPVAVLDNDAVIYDRDWLELCLEVMRRKPKIGLVGLKRIDLAQRPDLPDGSPWKTALEYLAPKAPGDAGLGWHLIVEHSRDVMGTVHVLSASALDRIGYWYQQGPYGYDDVLLCRRLAKAGFQLVFLPQVRLEHFDHTPPEAYTEWKRKRAAEAEPWFREEVRLIETGEKPVYYNPFEEANHAPSPDQDPCRAA